MDIIVLGIFKKEHTNLIEGVAKRNGLQVVWDYQRYNIEAEIGIKDLEQYYNLYKSGILVDINFSQGEIFYSYPLVNEISDYYMTTELENNRSNLPKLFSFFDDLERDNLQKLIVAFADEWGENTTVKIERINYDELKSRLNSIFVWCFGYRNLRTNSEIRDEFHPLVLEIENRNLN